MLTLKTNFLKYKDENGNMQDSGMLFAASQTDITLTESGIAADAKAVGEALEEHTHSFDELNNKPTEESALQMLMEIGVVQPAADSDNILFTDTDEKVFVL